MRDHLINLNSATASRVMSRRLTTIGVGDTVGDAFEAAVDAGIHHLPVMEPTGSCAGIIDLKLLELAACSSVDGTATEVGELAGGDLVTIASTTPLAEVARLMDERQTDAVLVIDGGVAVGIVSWRDLLRYIAAD